MSKGTSRQKHVEITREAFQQIGYQLVDDIAYFLDTIDHRPVAQASTPSDIRDSINVKKLPETGTDPAELMLTLSKLLYDHSTFNGHPRFWGYITSSATPIGILSDLLAASVNPNVGGWNLSPIATEIEKQTVKWLAELIDYPSDCGGLLVSGGNMANFVGFVAARQQQSSANVREEGMGTSKLRVYVSAETHTWIQKATDLFGLGTNSIRWIPTTNQVMNLDDLESQIVHDQQQGDQPFMVVGTAGTVSTGAIDPLEEIAALCKKYNCWFHVDGAYGAFVAALPDAPDAIKGISMADSVAMDPHKWLYSPLEAGCALVRDPQHLLDGFSYHPEYYHFGKDDEDPKINFYEYGFQNSRGFRALKVWMGLRHAGKNGAVGMIQDDIRLGSLMADALRAHGDFEVFTEDLSITTFRFNPGNLGGEQLNDFNSKLLTILQEEGKIFLSNAVIDGNFLLRSCIVNFRTEEEDVTAVPEIVAEAARQLLATWTAN